MLTGNTFQWSPMLLFWSDNAEELHISQVAVRFIFNIKHLPDRNTKSTLQLIMLMLRLILATRVSRPELFHLYLSLLSHIIIWCQAQIAWADHCSFESHLHPAPTDPDSRIEKWTESSISTCSSTPWRQSYNVYCRNHMSIFLLLACMKVICKHFMFKCWVQLLRWVDAEKWHTFNWQKCHHFQIMTTFHTSDSSFST